MLPLSSTFHFPFFGSPLLLSPEEAIPLALELSTGDSSGIGEFEVSFRSRRLYLDADPSSRCLISLSLSDFPSILICVWLMRLV